MLIPTFALPILEKSINRYFQLDPATNASLHELNDTVVCIVLTDWNTKLYLAVQQGKIKLFNHYNNPVNTTIRGSSFNLLRSKFSEPVSLTAAGIEIVGDIHLGEKIHQLLRNMDIDWEEHLSRWTGDIIAHQIGNFARATKSWISNSSDSLKEDFTNYLQQETAYLPTATEVEKFCHDVDILRNDTARLEALLKKLE